MCVHEIRGQTRFLFVVFRTLVGSGGCQIAHAVGRERKVGFCKKFIMIALFLHLLSYHDAYIVDVVEHIVPTQNVVPGDDGAFGVV